MAEATSGRLANILTLKEAAQLARAMGLALHYRHDLMPLCNAQLIPATLRAHAWLVTRATVRALVTRLLGLSISARRALYTPGTTPLVPLDLPEGQMPADLLVGYGEVIAYCENTLGWKPTLTLLAKNLGRLDHCHAGRLVITTPEAVQKFFLTVWRSKLRRLRSGVPPREQVPQTILSVAQMLVGEIPGEEVGPKVITALQATLAAAQTAQGANHA